jgi:hypothetical protein
MAWRCASKTSLRQFYKSEACWRMRWKFWGGSSSNEHLIQRLATYQSDPSNIACKRIRNSNPQGSVNIPLLTQIVKSSFLPKLSAKGKEYNKMEHKLEVPFAKRLLEHSMMGLIRLRLKRFIELDWLVRRGKPVQKHHVILLLLLQWSM